MAAKLEWHKPSGRWSYLQHHDTPRTRKFSILLVVSTSLLTSLSQLNLLRALILWALNTSEAITAIIKESYKQSRHDDDLNQPLSVHPWGKDGNKRRYWLIEGRDDTSFRLYRESNPALKTHTWRSMAGTIDELRAVAEKLKEEGSQAARRLGDRIIAAIPRFEATEEKRKRREYRMLRKAQFQRAEPGFSLYEGRTRGKRMRYTFDDDEEDLSLSDALPARRSTRHSGAVTPAEPGQPTVTASGRHVRARVGGLYGETLHSGQQTSTGRPSPGTDEYERSEVSEEPPIAPGSRSTRTSGRTAVNGWTKGRKHIEGYNSLDEMDDEDDASSSGAEWDGGDEDEPGDPDNDMDVDDSEEDDFEDEEEEPQSLIVTLHYRKPVSTDTIPKITETQLLQHALAGSTTTPSIKVEPPVSNSQQNFAPAGPQRNGGIAASSHVPQIVTTNGPSPEHHPSPQSEMYQPPGFRPSTLPYSPPKPTVMPMVPVAQTLPYPTPASSATTTNPPSQISARPLANPMQSTLSKGSIEHYFAPSSNFGR